MKCRWKRTFAEKAWDMVGRPRSSCASVKLASELPPLLLGCAPRKSDSVPLEKPGISPMLCVTCAGPQEAVTALLCLIAYATHSNILAHSPP